MVRQLIVAGVLGTLLAGPAVAVTNDSDDGVPACEETTLYGTVIVVDENQGLFSLLGTGLELQVSPEVDLADLEGRAVRIEVDPACSVIEIEVLDSASEAVA